MKYQLGEDIVHWNFGPGKIVDIEEKTLAETTRQYYVVEAGTATLWVPADEGGEKSLRLPTPSGQFEELLDLLRSPGEQLPEHQYQRQNELVERMQKRTLEDICCVIRDLACRSRLKRLNRNDNEVLNRAKAFLLDEWQVSLGVSRATAQVDLQTILVDGILNDSKADA